MFAYLSLLIFERKRKIREENSIFPEVREEISRKKREKVIYSSLKTAF